MTSFGHVVTGCCLSEEIERGNILRVTRNCSPGGLLKRKVMTDGVGGSIPASALDPRGKEREDGSRLEPRLTPAPPPSF